MSKIVAQEIKLQAVLLYRNILKLHYTKLNEEMRYFGDYFVKSEFTLNYRMADENQIKMFLKQWTDYHLNLKNMKDINTEIQVSSKFLDTKMDIDQRKSLDDIKNLIQNK